MSVDQKLKLTSEVEETIDPEVCLDVSISADGSESVVSSTAHLAVCCGHIFLFNNFE